MIALRAEEALGLESVIAGVAAYRTRQAQFGRGLVVLSLRAVQVALVKGSHEGVVGDAVCTPIAVSGAGSARRLRNHTRIACRAVVGVAASTLLVRPDVI